MAASNRTDAEREKHLFDWVFVIVPGSFLFVLCAAVIAAKAVG